MNTKLSTTILCLGIASIALAASPASRKRLTAQRVAELTTPTEAPAAKSYKIAISDFGAITLPADKPQGLIEHGRELIYPTEFDPPQPAGNGAPVLTPTTPAAFETINTGWSVRLTAKPHGRLVSIYGVADFVESELVPGGYGAIAGPIYTETGEVLTPNKLDQPKLQTTTTRFHVFAVPGESYEVIFYRGTKTEKHRISVTSE